MKNNKIKILTVQALIAAIYVVLTISNLSFSYGNVQFRYSESLAQLVVFNSLYWLPITLGVAIANLFSPLGIVDVFFGTLGTGLALYLSLVCFKFIKNRIVKHVINILIYLVVCMPIIAYELTIFGDTGAKSSFNFEVFYTIYGSLLLSQTIVMVIGVVLTEILNKTINLSNIFKK